MEVARPHRDWWMVPSPWTLPATTDTNRSPSHQRRQGQAATTGQRRPSAPFSRSSARLRRRGWTGTEPRNRDHQRRLNEPEDRANRGQPGPGQPCDQIGRSALCCPASAPPPGPEAPHSAAAKRCCGSSLSNRSRAARKSLSRSRPFRPGPVTASAAISDSGA